MAAQIHDHIHLGTTNPPAGTFAVVRGTWDPAVQAAVTVDFGLTGMAHVHQLLDDSGHVIVYAGDKMQIRCDSLSEMLAVRAMIGKQVYFASNYHDDDEDGEDSLEEHPDSAYVVKCLLRVEQMTNLDPLAEHWLIDLMVFDIGAVS